MKSVDYIKSGQGFPILIIIILVTLFIGYAPSGIALGLLAAYTLFYILLNSKKPKIDKALLIPILLYLLYLMSLFWTIDAELTAKGLGRSAGLIGIPLIFLWVPKMDKSRVMFIMEWFTRANYLYALTFLTIAAVKFLRDGSSDHFFYHELVAPLELNAIYVALFFVVSIAYLLSKEKLKPYDYLGLLFLIFMEALLSSKMVLIILVLILVLFFLRKGPLKFLSSLKGIITILIIAIIIGFASSGLVKRVMDEKFSNVEAVFEKQEFGRAYLWTGTSIRLFQLRLLSEQIREDGILIHGYGLFASRTKLKEQHTAYNTYRKFHGYNYHNQYAQTLAELGILGLILLLGMLVIQLWRSWNSHFFLHMAFPLIFACLFLTESLLMVQRGIFFFIILYCLLAQLHYRQKAVTD